jgi:hypothetical protein
MAERGRGLPVGRAGGGVRAKKAGSAGPVGLVDHFFDLGFGLWAGCIKLYAVKISARFTVSDFTPKQKRKRET